MLAALVVPNVSSSRQVSAGGAEAALAMSARQSQNPEERARQALQAGRYEEAERMLKRALKDSPEDGRLLLLLGEAHRWQDEYRDALEALRKAENRGVAPPRLHQLKGDALLALDRPHEALSEFERGPQSVRNQMGRAAALLALDKPGEALEYLDRAKKNASARQQKSLSIMRASALAMQRKRRQAADELARSGAVEEGYSRARELYRRLQPLERTRAARRQIHYAFTQSILYNDNAKMLPDDPSPAVRNELDDEESFGFGESARISYRVAGDRRRGLVARGAASAVQYTDIDRDFDDLEVGAGLTAYTTYDRLSLEAALDYTHRAVGYDSYGDIVDLRGTGRWNWTDWTRTDVTYRLSSRHYHFDVLPAEDPDGEVHELTVGQEFIMPVAGRDLVLSLSGHAGVDNADGVSAENDFYGGAVSGRYWLRRDLQVFASAAYRERDFTGPSIRSFTGRERLDETWRYRLGISWQFAEHWRLTGWWSRLDSDSNLDSFFAYDQNVFGLGVTFTGP